jgi:hypothetical protein
MPYSVPEALPLLNWLSKLTSLGAGLPGPSLSSVVLVKSETRPTRVDSVPSVPGRVKALSLLGICGLRVLLFVRIRFDIGSKDITRGFGFGVEAMSIVSRRYTFVSHDVVGDIVVGRVNVDVSIYAMVPRSN